MGGQFIKTETRKGFFRQLIYGVLHQTLEAAISVNHYYIDPFSSIYKA